MVASLTSRSDETTLEAGVGLASEVGVEEAAIDGVGVDVGKGVGVGAVSRVALDTGVEDGMGVAAAPQAMATATSSPTDRNRIALPLVKKSTFGPPVKVESGMLKSTGQHSNSPTAWHIGDYENLPSWQNRRDDACPG